MRYEGSLKHNCRVKKYPNGMVHITVFNRDVFLEEGWESIDSDELLYNRDTGLELVWNEDGSFSIVKIEKEPKQYNLFDPREDNIRRSKGKIFDIALSNDWNYMLTLTLDNNKIDRYDPKAIIRPFSKWLNNMVSRKGLNYLIVPELHEDGAIHFHGLINDALDLSDSGTVKVPDREKPIRRSTARAYGYDLSDPNIRPVYNVDNYHLGFSTAVPIDNNVEAVSKYMTKYTLKNFKKIFGQTFFAGGDINRELPNYCCDLHFNFVDVDKFSLPDNLGSVKYLLLEESVFELLRKEWER